MAIQLSEENLLLYPAIYNRTGLLGTFEVYVFRDGAAASLSGRRGPYTSIEEWFKFAGEGILGRTPEYVNVALSPGISPDSSLSGTAGDTVLLYRVSRQDAERLESIAGHLEGSAAQILVL